MRFEDWWDQHGDTYFEENPKLDFKHFAKRLWAAHEEQIAHLQKENDKLRRELGNLKQGQIFEST